MTRTNKYILKGVLLIFVYAIVAATIQSYWGASEEDASFYSVLIIIFIILIKWMSSISKWFKKRKNLKKNFKFVSENAPNDIGVYVASIEGEVVYVGRAIEERPDQSTRGLRKRIKEHYRGASTGNDNLFAYKNEIHMETYKTDSVESAKKLEAKLIRKYDTVNNGWNKRYED